MKILPLSILLGCTIPLYSAAAQTWKNECVSYYQFQLPDNLEVALYSIADFINPRKEPASNGDIKVKLYANPGVTFENTYYRHHADAVQAQFSAFYYGQYELDISSESETPINFYAYKEKVKDNRDFRINVIRQYETRDLKLLNKPITPKVEFDRRHEYLLKDYPNAFVSYDHRGYTAYINSGKRLYHFWGTNEKETGDKSQTVARQVQKSEPEVLSLLKRFRPRELYEVPTGQGFCLPYGFIADDPGHKVQDVNMGVTYRLKNHPDVSIFFADFGSPPGPNRRTYEVRPDPKMSAKEYVTDFWNVTYGHSFRDIKPYGKGFSAPTMDNRKAVAAFAKFTRYGKEVDYGYVAFAKGATADEPDLLFYVMRDSRQAKGQPPMDKDELEKMAEHIVASIKRR